MRIAVVGTAGSGKTTLAKALATQLGLPHIELDALNWQAGWRDLLRTDPDEFVRRVSRAIAAEAWVADGNYGLVRPVVWRRATHLVWLDYERPVIMYRVISRTLARVMLRTEMWAGNRERWLHMVRPSHPIRWAWSTWRRRRREYEERLAQRDYAHLVVLRLRRPREAKKLFHQLMRGSGPGAERLDRFPAGLLNAPCRGRARSSAGEHTLHTGGVTGSIPVAPTRPFNNL
jgi:adenylate kinase family enzyme